MTMSNKLLKGCKRPKNLCGDAGTVKERTAHLGYAAGSRHRRRHAGHHPHRPAGPLS